METACNRKWHYSWLICLAGTLAMFCCMGMTSPAFTIHLPYMVEEAGLTQTQTSLILTIRYLATVGGLVFLNRILDTVGLRKTVTLAAFMTACGFFFYGAVSSFAGYALCSVILGVSYAFGGEVTVSLMVVRWFRSRKGLALGLASFGSGIATMIMPPLVSRTADTFSIGTAFRMEAAISLAVCAAAFILIRDTPEDKGLQAYYVQDEKEQKTATERVRTADRKIIAAVSFACALFGMTANGMVSNFSLHYQLAGIPLETIPLLISGYGITLALGKILLGEISDLLGTVRTVLICGLFLTGGGVLSTLLIVSHSIPMAYLSAILLGLGLPIGFIGMSIYANDLAAPADYARILKNFKLSYMVGAILFGPVPGMFADRFGNYGAGYAAMTALTVAGIGIVVITYNYAMHRSNRRSQENL